jgi:hypothetical protein
LPVEIQIPNALNGQALKKEVIEMIRYHEAVHLARYHRHLDFVADFVKKLNALIATVPEKQRRAAADEIKKVIDAYGTQWLQNLLRAEQLRQFVHLDHQKEHAFGLKDGVLGRGAKTYEDRLGYLRTRSNLIKELKANLNDKNVRSSTQAQVLALFGLLLDQTEKVFGDVLEKIRSEFKNRYKS